MRKGEKVRIRKIERSDFEQVSKHHYTLSITEPLTKVKRLEEVFEKTGFWTDDSGAVAVVTLKDERLVGTVHFYRPKSKRHGFEIGYIIHDRIDMRKGYMSEAVCLLVHLLFQQRLDLHRIQLGTDERNVASWKLAERCGFITWII